MCEQQHIGLPLRLIYRDSKREAVMSTGNNKLKRNQLIGVIVAVVITFSMLLVFNEKISSKPTEAGFWMILIFGISLGVALTMIMSQVVKKKK
jgi:hypothetical protein